MYTCVKIAILAAFISSAYGQSSSTTPLAAGAYYWDPAHVGGAGGGNGTWYPASQTWYTPNAGEVIWSAGSTGSFMGNPGSALQYSSVNGGISANSLSTYNNYVILDKYVTSAPPTTLNTFGTVHFGSGLTTIDWDYADSNNVNTGVTWNTTNMTADQGAAVMFNANNLGIYKSGNQSIFSISNPTGLIGGNSAFWLTNNNFNTSIIPYIVYAKNDTLPIYNFVGYDSAHNSLRALVTANEDNNQQDSVIVSGSNTTENVRISSPQYVGATTTINSLVLDGLGYSSGSTADITGNGSLVITSGALLVLTSPPTFANPVVFPNGVEGHIFMGSDAGWNFTHYYPNLQASFSGTGGLTITGQIIEGWDYVNDTVSVTPNNDTMTLSGNSSYTGVTTLNAVRVAISSPSNFGLSNSVVLNAYAALAPTANNFLRSNESLTLNAGSMLDASGLTSSAGNVTIGSGTQGVTMTANTTLFANGSVTINSGAVLNLVLPAVPQSGESFTLISGAPISGVFAQINATYQGVTYPFTATYSGNNLVVTSGAGSTTSTVPITVTTSPSGAFAVDGITYTSSQTFQWTPGATHTIAVPTSPQSGGTGIQSVFSSWSDGGAQTHSITVPSSATFYTAYLTTQYYLTTQASPTADGSISPASEWVNSGSVIQLSATANSGYQFANFTGAVSGTTTPASLTVNAPATVTATFTSSVATTVPITVTTSPYGAFSVDGITYTTSQTFQWAPQSTHLLAVPSPQSGGTGIQSVFSSWLDGGAQSHSITVPSYSTFYTAYLTTQYSVTTQASPAAGGSISPASEWVNSGTVVQLSASANSSYQFAGFSGAVSGTTTPASLTVNAPATVTANFTPSVVTITTVPITVGTSPSGLAFAVDGTTYTSAQVFQWTPAATHTIAVATSPQSGGTGIQNVYSSWSDSGAQSHSITVPSSAASYTANFTTQYYVTTQASPAADGSISPANEWVNSGTAVQLSASANSGYQFTGFTGAVSGSTTPASLTVNAPATITANFTPTVVSSGGSNWYNGAWAYQKAITISHTQVSGSSNLTNFPVMISLSTDSSLAANAQSSGNDILFTDSSGTNKLNHEIQTFNAATGQLIAWVQVPSVSPTTDTVIYMYYGNPSASNQQNKQSVWDANYRGVWHLSQGTALTGTDSTSNGNNGTIVNAQPVAGNIGEAASFNTNASVNLGAGSGLAITGPITAEAWINVTNWPANGYPAGLLGMGYSYASTRTGWMLEAGTAVDGTHYVSWTSNNGTPHGVASPVTTLATDTWHHLAGTFDGASWKVYVDGVASASSADAAGPVNTGDDVVAGGLSTNGFGNIFGFNGLMDELRVSNTARTSGWIATEYNNQASPGNFVSVGSQQTGGGGTTSTTVPITVGTSPSGLAFAVDGTTYTSAQVFQWTPAATHTIAVATSPQSGGTGIQNVYSSWSDSGAQSHSITVPSSAASYTANFTTQYYVTTQASPAADGSISPASEWVNSGTAVQLSASANSGYQFTGFTGAVSGSTTPASLTVNAPATITANFTPTVVSSGGSNWYNGAWAYQKAITISHTQVSGSSNLTNFPVMISLSTDSSLAANAQSSGNDILFTDSSGTNKLNHEIQTFNAATGQLIAWVQVPSVSPTTDTVIYMYYGNPSASNQQNKQSVWDANYRGVWHLSQGTALTGTDSTSNGNNGTIVNAQPVAGNIGEAASFNTNASANLGAGSGLAITGPITAEAWINVTNWPANGYPAGLLGMGYSYASTRTGWMLEAGTDITGNHYLSWSSNNGIQHGVASPAAAMSTGTWHHVAGTFDGASWKMYVDGVASASSADAAGPVNTGDDVVAGGLSTNGYGTIFGFNGLMDELRVSNTARSGGWIATQYNNQSNPGAFSIVGPAQTAH